MLKICGDTICKPLELIFKQALTTGVFPSIQSGFKPGDSCINQLLSIVHEIYSSFDDGFEVRTFSWIYLTQPV